uniref:Uncharacterized protein n=1 Tax=Aegilops tauschii subsp. strangulata TaxID=200361 RepID=A0A453NWV0_AEGTS
GDDFPRDQNPRFAIESPFYVAARGFSAESLVPRNQDVELAELTPTTAALKNPCAKIVYDEYNHERRMRCVSRTLSGLLSLVSALTWAAFPSPTLGTSVAGSAHVMAHTTTSQVESGRAQHHTTWRSRPTVSWKITKCLLAKSTGRKINPYGAVLPFCVGLTIRLLVARIVL